MTKTTDSRQVGLLIGGILAKYEIDNLQLEIDLSSAVKRYFQEREKSDDKAGIRERILSDLQVAYDNLSKRETMQGRVKSSLGFNVDGERFDDMISFLLEEDGQGNTIEAFRHWWDQENEYKRVALWKIADRPALLREIWPQAFPANNPNNLGPTPQQNKEGFYV